MSDPPTSSDPPQDEQTGLSQAELLDHSLTQLHQVVESLIRAAGGSDRLSVQCLADSVTKIRSKYDNVLSELSRLDGEIIRAHERLDAAKSYLATIRKEASSAGSQQTTK